MVTLANLVTELIPAYIAKRQTKVDALIAKIEAMELEVGETFHSIDYIADTDKIMIVVENGSAETRPIVELTDSDIQLVREMWEAQQP